MGNLLGLGVFGTFGKPYGFQQFFYFDAVFNQTLDLNTNAIEIFPTTELYSIKREIYNGLHSICICKYSHANEINSSRGGTFIGSCILLNETYAGAANIYSLLTELHNDLISSQKNLINSTFQVQEARLLEVKEPHTFEAVKSQLSLLRDTDFYSTSVNPAKKILIVPKSNEAQATQIVNFIETAMEFFTDADTLYFTFDENVIGYVHQKGLLKSITWQEFLDNKEEIIIARAESKRLEQERKRQEEKKSTNRSARNNTTFEYWDDKSLKWGKDKGQVKKRIEEHNRLLDYCFELDERQSPKERQIVPSQHYSQRSHSHRQKSYFEQNKSVIFFVMNFLFIVIVALYLMFFNKPEVEKIVRKNTSTEQPERDAPKKAQTPNSTDFPNPIPNSELNPNDRRRVAQIGLKGKTGKDIVQSIFRQNPGDIEDHYSNQANQYLNFLISKNPDCFTKDKDVCNCDSLVHIPSFKKG
jgi:hypothetical protein